MDKFDFKAYIANNPLLLEQEELDLSDVGDDMADAADSLDNAIEDELEKQEELNEALDPASLLSYLLASTTVINILSKLSFNLTTSFLMSINSAKVPQIILAKRNPTAPPTTKPIKLPVASAETNAEVRITRIAKIKFKPASESAKYLFIFFASFSAFCSDTLIINLLYF